jgi:hypothetical protein
MRLASLLALALFAAPALADGNVTVFVDGKGNVIVIGDGKDNDVIHEAEGDLAIRGRNGTTVNGGSEPFFIPLPVTGTYFIELHDGDDRFETSTVLKSGTEIRTGDGDDRVAIGNSGASGLGLRIDTGAGEDSVDVQDSGFSILRILTGADADDINLVFAFADSFQLLAGSGDDGATLNECAFDGPVTLWGGLGEDTLVEGFVEYFGPQPKRVSWEALFSIRL